MKNNTLIGALLIGAILASSGIAAAGAFYAPNQNVWDAPAGADLQLADPSPYHANIYLWELEGPPGDGTDNSLEHFTGAAYTDNIFQGMIDSWSVDIGSLWTYTNGDAFGGMIEVSGANTGDGRNYTGTVRGTMQGANPADTYLEAIPDTAVGVRYNSDTEVDLTLTSQTSTMDPGGMLIGYLVQQSEDGGGSWVNSSISSSTAFNYNTAMTFSIDTLTSTTDYIFRVKPMFIGIHNLAGSCVTPGSCTTSVVTVDISSNWSYSDGVIPEFGTLVLPLLGVALMSLMLVRVRRKKDD